MDRLETLVKSSNYNILGGIISHFATLTDASNYEIAKVDAYTYKYGFNTPLTAIESGHPREAMRHLIKNKNKFKDVKTIIYISELYVHEQFRGHKIGHRILREFIETVVTNIDKTTLVFLQPAAIEYRGDLKVWRQFTLKLTKYYANVGFEKLPDGLVMTKLV